ncbi:ABC transporter substrate-binding protein [Epibacterium sp. SM1979]|uniref:ABC transporter substrate-binding protein n=1 Tax=Tritonibacter litoralis TaxID=2662264 RepID=A0A843YCV9_9RHOB|nr:ABC transporter substrate-binding protein [Tritonibacter litoralis]
MYGDPALPPDFVSLPYVNPDAPKGGKITFGATGGFDTLNPFVRKGSTPWHYRFWAAESLMTRSLDEPFTLYGVLAESIEVPDDRSWVEFTLNPAAKFSDGSPVTVEDVIWSYETLGTSGHSRYRSFWNSVSKIETTGPGKVRLSFSSDNRELALIAGLRPILKKAQWDGKSFADSGLSEAPISSSAYVVSDFEPNRFLEMKRNPDYWGQDLPIRKGTQNADTLRVELFGDGTVMFEAFKAGELSTYREYNANLWHSAYNFPRVQNGKVIQSEIVHQKPTGMTGLALNTRRAPLNDWRVRDALTLAFNFEYINETITGGQQKRIQSYFSGSTLGHLPGPASGETATLLEPFADHLIPGTLEGYAQPISDGSLRNRKNLRKAVKQLNAAGCSVSDGALRCQNSDPVTLTMLIRQSDQDNKSIADIYGQALERLGIQLQIDVVDNAQYVERESNFDFDIIPIRRSASLSPGNEQYLYWGQSGATQPGSRNLAGITDPAVDKMIDAMLAARSSEAFQAAARALDRLLAAGRYVIPIWQYDAAFIAHVQELKYPDHIPIYGDRATYFLPEVWWIEP